jgi:hypothetical protein
MQIAFLYGGAKSRNGLYIKAEAIPAPLTGRVNTA